MLAAVDVRYPVVRPPVPERQGKVATEDVQVGPGGRGGGEGGGRGGQGMTTKTKQDVKTKRRRTGPREWAKTKAQNTSSAGTFSDSEQVKTKQSSRSYGMRGRLYSVDRHATR